MRFVGTVGTFDLFHWGHVELMRRATFYGPLVAGVNADAFVATFKEPPIMSQEERLRVVEACKYVRWAEIVHDNDVRGFIRRNYIDTLVIGGYSEDTYYDQIGIPASDDLWRKVRLVFLPYTHQISTSHIKRRIRLGNDNCGIDCP